MAKAVAKSSGSRDSSDSNLLGAVAYLLGLITGIVLYFAKKDDSYVRYHAVQSILWSVSLWVVNVVLVMTVVGIVLVPIVGLVALISWLYAMWKAYNGERFSFPVIGTLAEQYSK